ncbi:hypothetical protein FRC01_007405 [Tulasnella sp. 417]|nr:hypothetical protein FRC01_007405 [Tulasnella sp. 417]
MYHNARKNSVVRHMKTQHQRVAHEDEIPFDSHLSSIEPPKMRRVDSSSSASPVPGSLESALGLPASQGPSDDELFRLSEEKRRVVMEITRKEHAEWMGGEDALNAAVPDYPVWTQRDHPYGPASSVEPEQSKHEAKSQSPIPELLTQAWFGGALACSDSMLPNYTASVLPFQLSSHSIVSDVFNVPGLERDTLFSPGAPSAFPSQQFYSPETPRNDSFLPTMSDSSADSIYSSQFLDDGASSSLFPDPTFGALGVLPQPNLIQDVEPEPHLPQVDQRRQ